MNTIETVENELKQLIHNVLKCPINKINIYKFKYNDTDIDVNCYSKTKKKKIEEYLQDCKDTVNLTFFEPFIRYIEELDMFFSTDLDYINDSNINTVLENTGLYIKK